MRRSEQRAMDARSIGFCTQRVAVGAKEGNGVRYALGSLAQYARARDNRIHGHPIGAPSRQNGADAS